MKMFWSFLLTMLFLGFSVHAQAQKKGKKTYKKHSKTKKNHPLPYSHYLPVIELPPSCELPKADEELGGELPADVDQLAFYKADEKPVFEECKNTANKAECFQKQLDIHVIKNINTSHVTQVNARVIVMIKIDKEGKVTAVAAKGGDKSQKKEVQRVINLLPKLIPARHNGKNIAVYYSYPIFFKFD